MKKPLEFDQLRAHLDDLERGPFPSSGFLRVSEGENGYGDSYGFYWPLGREGELPFICGMDHEVPSLSPAFSSTAKFIEWLRLTDGRWTEVSPVEDADFAPAQFIRARAHLKADEVEPAIACLRSACHSVPVSCEYWTALALQLRRMNAGDECIAAALNAYRSDWCFGRPENPVLRMLWSARENPRFADEPVIRRLGEITLKYGGSKENRNYPLLKEIVDEYLERGQAVAGLQLYQNYALMICVWETVSFRQRYHFDQEKWQEEYSALCAKHLGDSRREIR